MRFVDDYRPGRTVVSVEVFPPDSEDGLRRLCARMGELFALAPDYFHVAYGSLDRTERLALALAAFARERSKASIAYHISGAGVTQTRVDGLLDELRRREIENVVALRGAPAESPGGDFQYASQLVEHISRRGGFGVGVAGYPEKHAEAADMETDMKNLKTKTDAGADVIFSQVFYDNRRFSDFVDRCRAAGIRQPIVPGFLPILSREYLARVPRTSGATVPESLAEALSNSGDDAARAWEIGLSHTAGQVAELLDRGVAGLHFYVPARCFYLADLLERVAAARPGWRGESDR